MNNIFNYALAYTASVQPGFFEKLFVSIAAFFGIWFWIWLLGILSVISIIVFYIYSSICLVKIAKKTNTSSSWFAWVPILNIYLMCKIAGKPGSWVFWLLIPIINIIPSMIIPFGIVKKLNKPTWWGILMLLPITNIAIPGILAFSEDNNIVPKIKPVTPSVSSISSPETQTIKPSTGKKFCPGCGAELQSDDSFCLNCGEKL